VARAVAARMSSPPGSVVLGAPLAHGPCAPGDYELRIVVHRPANALDDYLLGHLSDGAQVFRVSSVGQPSFASIFSRVLGPAELCSATAPTVVAALGGPLCDNWHSLVSLLRSGMGQYLSSKRRSAN